MTLQEYLYSCNTVQDVIDRYTQDLMNRNQVSATIHANKLLSYKNMINDRPFLKDLRELFNETYDLLDKKHPNLHFSIAGRTKAIISSEKKIQRYFSLGKSLDLIRDFVAFRIILFGNESINLIHHCYQVIEEIIEFSAKAGYTPCERLPLIDVSNLNEHKTPYFSSFKYKQFVKDYICFPKENGYQSIHLVLVDTKGRYLEVQIRTLDMHAQIESSNANHSHYKEQKYHLVSFPIEREKIAIRGYRYVNCQVFDYAGVEYPITVFQRQKTF